MPLYVLGNSTAVNTQKDRKTPKSKQIHMYRKTITTTNTHHIQECLLKGKWLRCIMDLSLGTPGHCPGFIPKLCQD